MVSEAVITRLYFDVFLSLINLQTPFFTLRASVVVYLSLLLLGDTIHTDFYLRKHVGCCLQQRAQRIVGVWVTIMYQVQFWATAWWEHRAQKSFVC